MLNIASTPEKGDAVMSLGARLKQAREAKKWSLRKLEQVSGVSNAMISQLENEKKKNPSLSTLEKLGDALGIPVEHLLRGEEDDKSVPDIQRFGMPIPPPGWDKLTDEQKKRWEERVRAFEEFEIQQILREEGGGDE